MPADHQIEIVADTNLSETAQFAENTPLGPEQAHELEELSMQCRHARDAARVCIRQTPLERWGVASKTLDAPTKR